MPRAFELNAIVPSDIITLVEQFRKKTIATQCYLLYRYTIISKYIFSKSQLTQYDPCSSQSQRTILQMHFAYKYIESSKCTEGK